MMEPNEEEKQEKLPNDFDTPFSPPSGTQDDISDTHQLTDTNIDSHERYDEGISGAAEMPDQPPPAVISYTPPSDDDDDDEDDTEEE